MKTRMILICALLAALLLCACSQNVEQELPEDAVLGTEETTKEITEEIPKETVPVLCPPAPLLEITPLTHDPDRKETTVSTDESSTERADGTTVRTCTEYADDQNGKRMEERSSTYDAAGRLLSILVQKFDEAGNIRDRKTESYHADGSVLSSTYTIFDAQGRELLMREYATEENGSLRYDNSYRYEYGTDGSPVKTVSRHNPGGNAPSAREVYYGTAGAVIEESGWAFYETGSVKSWSYTRNAEDGTPLEEHRMHFLADGRLSMERLSRFAQSGAQLESKELSCHENGTVAHDFYEKYTEDGMLLEKSRLQYKEDGSVYFLHIEKYAETGEEIFYHHEQYFSDGSPEHKQLKEYYDNGQLHFWEYQSYHSPGVPANISYTEYDAAGNLLKKEVTGYNKDGIITSQSKYPAEDTEFMPVKKETFHDNGNPEYIYDGLYNTDNLLMEGKAERYYENGQLWIQEIASYEEATRTRTSTETRYLEDGTVDFAWQRLEVFDEAWQRLRYESTTLGSDLSAEHHEVYLYTYDADGNVLTADSTTYDGSGTVAYKGLAEYTYDGQGNVACENRIQLNADGTQQSRMEMRYTYSDDGKRTGYQTVQYDADDAVTFRSAEEYDENGLLLLRTTETGNNLQTEAYTYFENGRTHTLLVTITPKEGGKDPVIRYRKTTWEYHENGSKKSETVQTWTSQDEKKAAPGTPQSELGSTYITQFDEQGNVI